MRDGTSIAKTNKMRSSITPWGRVSYGAAPNEENRPDRKKTAVYPQLGRVMTDKTCSHSFISAVLTPSALSRLLWSRQKQTPIQRLFFGMLCSLEHHKPSYWLKLSVDTVCTRARRDRLSCIGQAAGGKTQQRSQKPQIIIHMGTTFVQSNFEAVISSERK